MDKDKSFNSLDKYIEALRKHCGNDAHFKEISMHKQSVERASRQIQTLHVF